MSLRHVCENLTSVALPADVVAGLPVREFRWYKGRQHSKSPGRAGRISIAVPSVSRAYALSLARVLMPPFLVPDPER
jgi:hypothetical protein